MSPRKITLRIEQITVAGPHLSRAALRAAVESELGRLLALPGTAEGLRAAGWTPHLDGGRVAQKAPGEAALGQAVAHATMGALRR